MELGGTIEFAVASDSVTYQQASAPITVRFDGLIDDVRFYGRALSAAEVKALSAAQ